MTIWLVEIMKYQKQNDRITPESTNGITVYFDRKQIASLYNRFSATRSRIPEKRRAQRHGRETPPRLAACFSKNKTNKVTELRLLCAELEQ
jgi:hypothetical protein